MLKLSCFCLIALAMLVACASQNGTRAEAWEKKVDPRLRTAAHNEGAQLQSVQNLQVLIKCTAPLSAEQKKQLADMGARVQAEAGAIITASLPAQAVTEVAKLDYVIYLELSKERKISSPGN